MASGSSTVLALAPLRARAEPFVFHELLDTTSASSVSISLVGTTGPDPHDRWLLAQLGGALDVARTGLWLDLGAPVRLGDGDGWLRSSIDDLTLGISGDVLSNRRGALSVALDSSMPLTRDATAAAPPADVLGRRRSFPAWSAARAGTLTARGSSRLYIGRLLASAHIEADFLLPGAPDAQPVAPGEPGIILRPSAGVEYAGGVVDEPAFDLRWTGALAPGRDLWDAPALRVDSSLRVPLRSEVEIFVDAGSSLADPTETWDLLFEVHLLR